MLDCIFLITSSHPPASRPFRHFVHILFTSPIPSTSHYSHHPIPMRISTNQVISRLRTQTPKTHASCNTRLRQLHPPFTFLLRMSAFLYPLCVQTKTGRCVYFHSRVVQPPTHQNIHHHHRYHNHLAVRFLMPPNPFPFPCHPSPSILVPRPAQDMI
jgi:hypothetical protein